jgi:hypothetical protein
LYGCETWSLALREEHKLRVFENLALRRICGPKKDEVTGRWRKLHNEELHNLYFSPSIIRIMKLRKMRWAGHVARMGEKSHAFRLFMVKSKGKRPLGRPRCRRLDDIKMDIVEIRLVGVDLIDLAQDRYSSCECGNETSVSIKCWETTEWLHKLWPLEWYSVPQS